ncbi:MAG: DNA-processing protein DprA [Bacteroidota bacterium]
MSDETIQRLALSFIDGLGPIRLRRLISAAHSLSALFSYTQQSPLSGEGINNWYLSEEKKTAALEKGYQEHRKMAQHDVQFTNFLDSDFPAILNHYPDTPLNLFYRGTSLPDHRPSIGIVGTRKPSQRGIDNTNYLVNSFKTSTLQFVSGLAYGIDVSMHQACVAQGLCNFAILGHGLHTIYPWVHRQTASAISKNGALLTEYPIGTKPDRQHFPARNRIIAALCDVLVVVESKEKGGSIITAELANQYHKEVFAFPGRIDDESSKGCNRLIKNHQAHLLQDVKDIRYITGWAAPSEGNTQISLFDELNENEERIITLFRASKTLHIDQIQQALGFEHSDLSSHLLSLEFKGIIRPLPGKSFTILKV